MSMMVSGTVKLSSPRGLKTSAKAAPNATRMSAVRVSMLKLPTNQCITKNEMMNAVKKKTEVPGLVLSNFIL